jgi:hypothetical protein
MWKYPDGSYYPLGYNDWQSNFWADTNVVDQGFTRIRSPNGVTAFAPILSESMLAMITSDLDRTIRPAKAWWILPSSYQLSQSRRLIRDAPHTPLSMRSRTPPEQAHVWQAIMRIADHFKSADKYLHRYICSDWLATPRETTSTKAHSLTGIHGGHFSCRFSRSRKMRAYG